MKTLIIYVFHEYNDRVQYFIDNAIFKSPNDTFMMVCNNKDFNFTCPDYVIKINRPNVGFDFGAWSHGLLTNDFYTQFDNYILVNSSVLGPYMKNKKKRWTQVYLDGLDKYKLFGSTINTEKHPELQSHVQSYIFAFNKKTLMFLIKNGIFSLDKFTKTKQQTIDEKERCMSKLIIQHGWNIGCLIPMYKEVDFSFRTKKPQNYGFIFRGNLMKPWYHNIYWNEYDLVFIKGNRVNLLNPKLNKKRPSNKKKTP